MSKLISAAYLLGLGFERCTESRDNGELRDCFRKEVYDAEMLISPMPDGACVVMESGEVVELPVNEKFELGHTDDWQIFINGWANHLTTLNYQHDLDALLKLIDPQDEE